MDTLTHALSGALLARASAPRSSPATLPGGRRMLVGALAASFPDLDFVTAYVSPIFYLQHHRGITHSLAFVPLWALAIACLCSLAWRRDRSWRAYFGIAAMGVALHILGDLITSYGTMIFAPFSDARYAWDTTFIIDLWFSGILLAGLLASWAWRRSRVPAAAGLAVLATYVGWQATLQHVAVEFGRAYALGAGINAPRVTAQPRPASPLNWMVLVEEGERLDYAMVRLSQGEAPPPLAADAGFLARISAPYLPLNHAVWVTTRRFGGNPQDASLARAAWQQPGFEFFRWFAAYPVVYRVDHDGRGNPETCAWFQDLRFFTPGRSTIPFRYGLCREGEGPWRTYRLMEDNTKVPVP
ncbi:MAG TPA: metal-dependent hydrolase [Burkholderiales bacterium]|nr:metal-dependent hydrolase [Burkholderiales bacterium]